MPESSNLVRCADVRIQELTPPAKPLYRPTDADMEKLARMIEDANTVAIFGGEGCRDAHEEVITLAAKLKAPVGYSFRGKQWLEHDNPYAVGMTGLLGYGGAYKAIHEADLLLLLGTAFPFPEFLSNGDVKKVRIDRNVKHLGRRCALDLAFAGGVKSTLASLLPRIAERKDTRFLEKHLGETHKFEELLNHYVEKGPCIKPIRPEFLALMCRAAQMYGAPASVSTKNIAECKHGETAVAAERNCLPAGKGELSAESIGSGIGH